MKAHTTKQHRKENTEKTKRKGSELAIVNRLPVCSASYPSNQLTTNDLSYETIFICLQTCISDDALSKSACALDSAKAKLSIFPYFFCRWDIQPVKHNSKKISGSYGVIPLTESHVSLIILRKNLNRLKLLSHTQTSPFSLLNKFA